MALTQCKECKKEISDQATSCPHCGAPNKKKKKTSTFGVIVMILIILFTIGRCSDETKTPTARPKVEEKPAAEKECQIDDLQCWGNKGSIAAHVYCADHIERLATHSVKWTDGTFEHKFSRFRWKTTPGGIITFIGDKAEFQNGFGAYTPVIYECDMPLNSKEVLEVRFHAGRLPVN